MTTAHHWGNQHASRKAELMAMLLEARWLLDRGFQPWVYVLLLRWRTAMQSVPASTRRRWKCGK